MRFKQLELTQDGNWFSRTLKSARFRTSLKAILVGAAVGFLFYYLTEGRLMESMPGGEILKSLAVGAFFGFFITNSPCARGRC